MTVAETIIQHVRTLPELVQIEVLDFIEYIETKTATQKCAQEEKDWTMFSLSQAMRGMEDERTYYGPEDLKEVFS